MTKKYPQINDLKIYSRSLELSINVIKTLHKNVKQQKSYQLSFLVDQLSRSVASIGSNIAEGFGRLYKRDFKRFLSIARASSYESLYWVEIANRLGLIDNKNRVEFEIEIKELIKMITSFMKKLEV